MKIQICDIYKKDKGILKECNRHLSVKEHPELRLDVCEDCSKTTKIPMKEYKELVYRIKGWKQIE